MQEDLKNKSVALIINSSKLTARTLATAFMKLLHYSRNKLKEHHEDKHDVKPQGKQTIKELIAQNQGVEKTELADRKEVKAFDRIAKQYSGGCRILCSSSGFFRILNIRLFFFPKYPVELSGVFFSQFVIGCKICHFHLIRRLGRRNEKNTVFF